MHCRRCPYGSVKTSHWKQLQRVLTRKRPEAMEESWKALMRRRLPAAATRSFAHVSISLSSSASDIFVPLDETLCVFPQPRRLASIAQSYLATLYSLMV